MLEECLKDFIYQKRNSCTCIKQQIVVPVSLAFHLCLPRVQTTYYHQSYDSMNSHQCASG